HYPSSFSTVACLRFLQSIESPQYKRLDAMLRSNCLIYVASLFHARTYKGTKRTLEPCCEQRKAAEGSVRHGLLKVLPPPRRHPKKRARNTHFPVTIKRLTTVQ